MSSPQDIVAEIERQLWSVSTMAPDDVIAEAHAALPDLSAPPTFPAPPTVMPGMALAFATKDSGARESYDSGMVRDTAAGKMRPDLVRDGPMFMRWVMLLTRGAVKYAARNWMKAAGRDEFERFLESTDRHYLVWFNWRRYGINLEDPDHPTRLPLTEDHGAAVFFNMNGAEYVIEQMPSEDFTIQKPAAQV